jgi:hypothetical protein
MVRSIPSPSVLYAGKGKYQHEEEGEAPSLAKEMYKKRIVDERFSDEAYYYPEQPRVVAASEDLVADAAPYPFHDPMQCPRVKDEVPTGQVIIRFRFRKWGCGSPFEKWGFDGHHIFPPEFECRMTRQEWIDAMDQINDGFVKVPWPKLVWYPFVIGILIGAILEGALRSIRYLSDGAIFSIFAVSGLTCSTLNFQSVSLIHKSYIFMDVRIGTGSM